MKFSSPFGRLSFKATSFALIGGLNTILDTTIFFLLLAYVTSSIAAANVGAWLCVIVWSFVMNSLTTFSAETGGKPRLKHFPGFVGSGIMAVTASTIAIVLAAKVMPVWAAKAVAILVSFCVNFSITHFLVFPAKGERDDA
jgi:putative flippase GtrA